MNLQEEFLDRLKDVEMDVTVRFGHTELALQDVAALGSGSMIELNRTVDEPVELLVNNCPFARGEVVVVDGYYSVRITEVSPPEKSPNTFLAGAMNKPNDDAKPETKSQRPAEGDKPPAQASGKPAPPKPQAGQKPPEQKKPAPPPAKKPGEK